MGNNGELQCKKKRYQWKYVSLLRKKGRTNPRVTPRGAKKLDRQATLPTWYSYLITLHNVPRLSLVEV